MKGLSLFAGAGIGETFLADCGIDIITSNELVPKRAALYKATKPSCNVICGDIRDVNVFTIVITPRYVPAVKTDILDQPIVMVLANTFAEYLYNHIHHDVREIDYCDFDDIIINNLGNDVSKLISDMTMEKFASH